MIYPHKLLHDMVPQIILKLHSQDTIFNNNWEIIILVKFPDRKVHPRHIQNLIRYLFQEAVTLWVFAFFIFI